MYRRILVPTDGSAMARAAQAQAITLAQIFDAELHGIHVLEGDVTDQTGETNAEQGDEDDSALAALTEFETRAADAGLSISTTVLDRDGPTHLAIVDYATEQDVDCIVMGTHSRSGLDRYLVGSVTERVLRTSEVPVLTVHEAPTGPDIESVLLPTDGSECALAAGAQALTLAKTVGATLFVLYVADVRMSPISSSMDRETIRQLVENADEDPRDFVLDLAGEKNVDTVEVLRVGVPHDEIRKFADENGVDLVVMGTHGRTGLERTLLGSVTERVVRTTETPVLSVRGGRD